MNTQLSLMSTPRPQPVERMENTIEEGMLVENPTECYFIPFIEKLSGPPGPKVAGSTNKRRGISGSLSVVSGTAYYRFSVLRFKSDVSEKRQI